MPFTQISELLSHSSRKRGLSAQVEAAMILEFFSGAVRDLLPESAQKSMRPLYFKDSTLTVAVLSPALTQELKLREPQIIERINVKMGKNIVTSVRYLS